MKNAKFTALIETLEFFVIVALIYAALTIVGYFINPLIVIGLLVFCIVYKTKLDNLGDEE